MQHQDIFYKVVTYEHRLKLTRNFEQSTKKPRKSFNLSTYRFKPITIDKFEVNRNNDDCEAESVSEKIGGKSIFTLNGAKRIRINQHRTKYVFDDFSYIVFSKNDFTAHDKGGNVVSHGFHANKRIL